MVSARDVAEAAGVSISTVSRALSSPDQVAERTREQVRAAAQALGYRPNPTAQGLRVGRNHALGLIVPDLENPFFASITKGIQARAQQAGYVVVVTDSDEDPVAEADLVAALHQRTDGLLLCSPRSDDDTVSSLTEGIPTVVVNRLVPGMVSIAADDADGARQALGHLRALGHRRIAVAAGPVRSWSGSHRTSGLRAAAQAAGDVELIHLGHVDAGNLSIDLVLTGNDGLSSGIGQGLWIQVVNEHGDRISNQANYLEEAAAMQALADGYGVVVTYYPSGPLLQYDPAVVTDVPSTPEELLAWAKAHPGKFGYARPANSGPGRTLLMGLPYILGDSDPTDPENGWEKTWAYLRDLGQYIDNYPTGTGQVITNLGDGTWAMIPTTTGWEIEPRTDGRLPNTLEAAHFDSFTWVTDAHYAAIPKGQSPDKISAILLLLQDMLTPEQNAKAYDNGYFYPGPAIKGATLDLAPAETQQIINEYRRDWFDALIESEPKTTPLPPAEMVKAFDIWDREVGAGKYQA